MMKSMIFLADGMADCPLPELGGRTPLEAARTPAMDSIAARGVNGTFLTLPDGLPTSSDVANMSVLGLSPERNYPGRGPIEAASQGIALGDGDVAWRCNLVTVSEDGVLLDYSAGHIPDGTAAELMRDLQREFGGGRVTFHHGVSYRNLLVLHGREFSGNVAYHKPDSSQDMPVSELGLTPLDDSEEALRTVSFLRELCGRAHGFLVGHPLNRNRPRPATDIWPWSPGVRPSLPSFSDRYAGRKGAIISAVDVIKGIGRCTGMRVVDVPGATGYLDTDYEGKVDAALTALKDCDFVYLHVEAIDECSHQGDLKLKMRAIEDFDSRIVAPALRALEGTDVRFGLLPDHPVPIRLRRHTVTPVPVAVCGPGIEPDAVTGFSERLAPGGSLGLLRGDELMKLVLGLR